MGSRILFRYISAVAIFSYVGRSIHGRVGPHTKISTFKRSSCLNKHRFIRNINNFSILRNSKVTFDDGNPYDRIYVTAARHLAARQSGIEHKHRCSRCFMSSTLCICAKVKQFFQEFDHSANKINPLVYMHYKEWGRASNTGKILPIGLPEISDLFIFGRKEDEDRLRFRIETEPTLIVYPSANARPIIDFKDWFDQQSGSINLIVLDTTWGSSKTLDRSLPADISRVNVDFLVSAPSQFLNRKQSTTNTKISTLEAMAFAMQALGESERNIAPMLESLRYSVDAVLRQGGRPTAYQNDFIEAITKVTEDESSRSPFNFVRVSRPERCPYCSACAQEQYDIQE